MKYSIKLLVLMILLGCNQPKENASPSKSDIPNQREVLLIGTFHYNNPGKDVAKTKSFDILSEQSQSELKKISKKIKEYNPTKIFVEWPYDEQVELDSLYNLYLNDNYFTNQDLSDFYLKNEIFQLAFRTAKENGIKRVYGIDYSTSFPFGEVMAAIEKANQTDIKAKINDGIARFTNDFDNKIEAGISLTELTYYLNTQEMRYFSNDFHNNLMLVAGDTNDFSGPTLTSEWFKRNLFMWSLIQKNTSQEDERILVLAGASHAAMFDLFISANNDWKVVELKEVMN